MFFCSDFIERGGEIDVKGPVPVGENLQVSAGSLSPRATVLAWFEQNKDYNYDTNACTDVCGAYTQVLFNLHINL